MKRPPVYLTVRQRVRAVDEFLRSLQKRGIELVALSIDRVHFHVLARFPDHDPRHWIGIAKKESSHYLKQEGLAPVGGLWATRFEVVPVEDRRHQVWVVGYILRHARKGGAVKLIRRD
jgi:REP element-mobilizing transposase RayT